MENNKENSNVTPIYIDTKRAAEILGFSHRGLDNLRSRGLGPSYFRLNGRTVRYRLDDVIAWAERNRVELEGGAA